MHATVTIDMCVTINFRENKKPSFKCVFLLNVFLFSQCEKNCHKISRSFSLRAKTTQL